MRITDAKLDATLARVSRIDRDLHAMTTGNYRAADEARIRKLRKARTLLDLARDLIAESKKANHARDND